MFEPFKTRCVIHSLDGQEAEATIVNKVGNNNYIAEYGGVKCSAIYNPFVGRFYVDDKYGIIRDAQLYTGVFLGFIGGIMKEKYFLLMRIISGLHVKKP